MRNDTKKICQFLQNLGFSQSEANIYSVLIFFGKLTTLEISKAVNLPRTSVYRLVGSLKQKGVVEEIIDDHKSFFIPAEISKLENLIRKKEKEITEIKTLFPQMSALLSQNANHYDQNTKVLFYRGKEGMKQMLWNILKTEDLFRGYSYCTPVETTGPDFALEWALEFQSRGLLGRDFYSDLYLKSARDFPYPKEISWKFWESKYISPKILGIDHQIDIYNDVLAFYTWHDREIFGVEIHNQKMANLQKQIFDVLWKTENLKE